MTFCCSNVARLSKNRIIPACRNDNNGIITQDNTNKSLSKSLLPENGRLFLFFINHLNLNHYDRRDTKGVFSSRQDRADASIHDIPASQVYPYCVVDNATWLRESCK